MNQIDALRIQHLSRQAERHANISIVLAVLAIAFALTSLILTGGK